MNFWISGNSGEVITSEEVKARVEASIKEFQSQVDAGKEFLRKLDAGEEMAGTGFLDVQGVVENGYDRTGPDSFDWIPDVDVDTDGETWFEIGKDD